METYLGLRQSYSYPWQFGYSENNGLETPVNITAGDSYDLSVSNGDYKASDGWSFKLYLRGASSLDLTGTADPDNADNFKVTLTAADSANLVPGHYQFMGRFTKGSESHVPAGYLVKVEVLKNLATSKAPFDPRSDSQQILELIVNAIKTYSADPIRTLQLNGKMFEVTSLTDLFKLKKKFEWEVAQEVAQEKLEKGLGRPGIHFRFQKTSG